VAAVHLRSTIRLLAAIRERPAVPDPHACVTLVSRIAPASTREREQDRHDQREPMGAQDLPLEVTAAEKRQRGPRLLSGADRKS
jgi:hypothetical protein